MTNPVEPNVSIAEVRSMLRLTPEKRATVAVERSTRDYRRLVVELAKHGDVVLGGDFADALHGMPGAVNSLAVIFEHPTHPEASWLYGPDGIPNEGWLQMGVSITTAIPAQFEQLLEATDWISIDGYIMHLPSIDALQEANRIQRDRAAKYGEKDVERQLDQRYANFELVRQQLEITQDQMPWFD